MAKSTPKKDKTPDKVPKVKTTGSSIIRDHPLDNVIQGRRKRVPTERLVASLKQKPKAPVAKKGAGGKKKGTGTAGTPKGSAEKGLNRTRTMADTIADSKKHLKGGRPKGRTRSISKSKSKGKGKKK